MAKETDKPIELLLQTLDSAETGGEFTVKDLWLLAILGAVIPVILLAWGWFL